MKVVRTLLELFISNSSSSVTKFVSDSEQRKNHMTSSLDNKISSTYGILFQGKKLICSNDIISRGSFDRTEAAHTIGYQMDYFHILFQAPFSISSFIS